jgi:hypothetical protein
MAAIAPQLPCIERQHALSSCVIALPVMQAIRGPDAETRMSSARVLTRRRIITYYMPAEHWKVVAEAPEHTMTDIPDRDDANGYEELAETFMRSRDSWIGTEVVRGGRVSLGRGRRCWSWVAGMGWCRRC